MLNFTDLVLRRGPRVLIDKLNLTIFSGQRVGITGRNGTGKSSLLSMLLGELAPDAGDLSFGRDLVFAHVRQETPALEISALDYVLDGDVHWRDLNTRLQQAEANHEGDKIALLHEKLHAIDGYTAPTRAARLLHGLGFAVTDDVRPVSAFSGGWRMRLNLAQALMCRSDVLLLDEPTNHLDLDAVVWVQDWLNSYPGTLLVISHDRDFLDSVTTHILHIERNQATQYTGNYSSSEKQRAERINQQAAEYATQQRHVAHLQSFVDRFKAKASKARQAQSRVKMLEKMQLVAPAHWDTPFDFRFAELDRLPAPLLSFQGVAAGYNDQAVVENINLTLAPGDRIALLGRNGAGKSTVMRTLAGSQAALGGEQMRDRHLKVGYFAQHQLDSLHLPSSPMAHLERLNKILDVPLKEQELRDYLGGFDFHGERVFEAIEPFSGGEKARLALALLVWQKPNLLLLDEPTNHLDLEMRHALELALQGFEGAVVMVSHDRHMLASTVDQLWVVGEGSCQPFVGDLDDYASFVRKRVSQEDQVSASPSSSKPNAREQRQAAAAKRATQKPWRDELKRCERDMERLEAALGQREQELSDPALYVENPQRASELAQQQTRERKQLDEIEARWLELAELLQQDDD
ncbi:MAG: ATP-binding cassette domain-containing protein [Oceanococcus sp.]